MTSATRGVPPLVSTVTASSSVTVNYSWLPGA
jgi:hypothetical protein